MLKEKIAGILYVKIVLFVILVLATAFFLLVFVFGIILFLISGDFAMLVGGVSSFGFSIVSMVAAKKFEPAWDEFERIRGVTKKTATENLTESLPFIGSFIFLFIFAAIFQWYFSSFLSVTINPTLGKEMLEILLTVDGILMGFYGVVLAQTLAAIHNKGNVIYEQMIRNRNDPILIQALKEEVQTLKRKRTGHIVALFYSMMPLLASILFAFGKISTIDVAGNDLISTNDLMFAPLLAMIVGIILLVMVMLQFNLLPDVKTDRD